MDLSVVILNWNTAHLLETCLNTLQRPQPGIRYEVIVVDNASEDNSREVVRTKFPNVKLMISPKNVGFGAGNNFAVPESVGRYILFLNSDTEVMEGALTEMVCYADAHPDIGILGPKLLNGDGSLQYSCRRYPNLATGFFRNTPLGRLFPHNRFATDYLMQEWDHAAPRDVDWVSGAALMIRRTLVTQIGAFDDDFYMYCEDVDLCWRANHAPLPPSVRKAADAAASLTDINNAFSPDRATAAQTGQETAELPTTQGTSEPRRWRVTYLPQAIIYHLIGRSSDQVPTRMTYEFHRSQYLFYRKHYAASTPLPLRPLIPVGIALRALGQLTRHRLTYWKRRMRGEIKPKPKR